MNKRQKIVQQAFLDNEEAIIHKLKNQYHHTYKEIDKKAKKLHDEFEELKAEYDTVEDEAEREVLKSRMQSKVYQKQYQESLKKQVGDILDKMQEKEFTTVSDYLNKCYEEAFVGTIYDLQGQGIPLCFPLDQEAMVRAVQLDSKISQGLYSRLGEDVSLLKKKITAQVSRCIATGMSYQQMAQQLAGQTNIGFNNAVRIARTEGHRIQCQSTMDACYKATEKGADVVKQWDSTLDARTRSSHVHVDGEIKELDEKFSNGLMFPGDPSGRAAEVINCRCALLERARWAVGGSFTKMNNFTKQLETFESPEAYSEFKKGFFSKENKKYMNYVQQMEDRHETKDFRKVLEKMTDREYKHYSKLLENNPMFNKKSLTNSGNGGKIPIEKGQKKPFTKVKVEDIPSMDEQKFKTIKRNFENQGVAVIQDVDGDEFLKGMGAEALTLSDGSAIIFQRGRTPSASAVFEEAIHVSQIKKNGMIKSTGDVQGSLEYLTREIEANEKLLKYQKAYGLTDKDVESVQENLNGYYEDLKEVKKHV